MTGLSILVVKANAYGRIYLFHHQEARPSVEVKVKNGAYVQGEVYRPAIMLLHTQFKALVQGLDFEINDLGEISRLR